MRSAGLGRPAESGVHRPLPCAPYLVTQGDAMIEPLQTVGHSHQPERPPGDTAEYVGMGNAINEIGRASFGEGWTGERDARWTETTDKVLKALQLGDLVAARWLRSLFAEVNCDQWSDDGAKEWVSSGKVRAFGVSSWLFVTRSTLSAYLRERGRLERGQTSAAFDYSYGEHRWRLFDAAVWIATGGHPTTTGDIARNNYEDVGCRLLFKALDERGDGLGGPQITGLLSLLERRIPVRVSWERAHTGWLGSQGHRVMFYEDPGEPGQIRADLYERNRLANAPSYVDLRIERDELIKLFPQQDRGIAPRKKGGPRTPQEMNAEKLCENWLYDLMDASPEVPTHANREMQDHAKATWNVGRDAYRRAKGKAMARGKGRFAAWADSTKAPRPNRAG